MATDNETETTRGNAYAIGAGVTAGILGGIVMALAAMIRASVVGAGFWLPAKNIAAVWYGVGALIAGVGAVIIGILTHLVVSAFWGAIYGLGVDRDTSIGVSFAVGLVYGIAVWLVMTYIALPIFNATMAARVALQPSWFWFGIHLLFGGTVGIMTPALVRAMSGEAATEPAAPEPEPTSGEQPA